MPNTSNRIVAYQDGEGLDLTDLNRHQLWQTILENDYRLGMLTRTDPDVATPWQETAFTSKLHRYHNAGCVYAGASARQLKNKRGMIAKWIAAPDFTEPKLLTYFLDEDEINLTSAAGDATNPRYDIIAIKLEWENVSETRDFKDATTLLLSSTSMVTHKRVKMTARIVAGTPAASPTLPAIAADEAYYAVYKIPATFNAVINLTPTASNEFRDFTFPIGEIKTANILGGEMQKSSGWTVDSNGSMSCAGAAEIARGKIGEPVAGEWKVLRIFFQESASLTRQYGFFSTADAYLFSAPSSDFSLSNFGAIDAHTCNLGFRLGAWTMGTQWHRPIVKYTSTAAAGISRAVAYYK